MKRDIELAFGNIHRRVMKRNCVYSSGSLRKERPRGQVAPRRLNS
jgi:hypothetical protein